MILAIDPGKIKCGLAVLDEDGLVILKTILKRETIVKELKNYLKQYPITALVIGKGSFGTKLEREIGQQNIYPNVIFIPETNSSLEARTRYWQNNQPKGFWKLIPTSLRLPPVPIDDYAAVILAERYLKS